MLPSIFPAILKDLFPRWNLQYSVSCRNVSPSIHRHSGSRTALITISRKGEQILVEIEDHGKGMSPEQLAEIQAHGTGVGIRGMRERLRHFNGELAIESSSSGTKISAFLPSPTTAKKEVTLPT